MIGPDKTSKFANNVPGKYYVDIRCIGCSVCAEIAPKNFCSDLEEGYEYVCKQPTTSMEETLCMEAMEICPVNAIWNDGVPE
jgi:ferredoxin